MCVCLPVLCICVCSYVCVCVSVLFWMCIFVSVYVCACVCVSMSMHLCVSMSVHVYLWCNVCKVCVCADVSTCGVRNELPVLFFKSCPLCFMRQSLPLACSLLGKLGWLTSPKDLPFSASSALRIKVQLFYKLWGLKKVVTLLGGHFIVWTKNTCSQNYKKWPAPILLSCFRLFHHNQDPSSRLCLSSLHTHPLVLTFPSTYTFPPTHTWLRCRDYRWAQSEIKSPLWGQTSFRSHSNCPTF